MNANTSTSPARDMQATWRTNRRVRAIVRIVGLVTTAIVVVLLAIGLYRGVSTGDFGLLLGVVMAVIVLGLLITAGVVVAISISRRNAGGVSIVDLSTAPATGTLQTLSRTIDAGNTRSIRAQIEMTAGSLDVMGDALAATAAAEARFRYDDADWKPPQVQYTLDAAGQGALTINQQATGRFAAHQGPNEWLIRLNNSLPTDLSVTIGAGDADLRLNGLYLTSLNVVGGVGAVTVDLTGDWRASLNAFIKGSVGRIVIGLPDTIGVIVETSMALGAIDYGNLTCSGDAYVNALYGAAPVTLRLMVEGGMGQISLE